jgi:hypothetical protein
LFATLLTGPRISTDDVTPSNNLSVTWKGEKYAQYYTIFFSRKYLCVGPLIAKIPPFGWWSSEQGANLTSL